MKVILLFVAVCSAAAEHLHDPQGEEAGISDQYKSENDSGDYAFGYNEDHSSGGSFRREIGDPYGHRVGSYGLRDRDGRVRVVNYIADDFGFRADIQTNEPGVKSHTSGAATFTKMNIGRVFVPGFVYSGGPSSVIFEKHDRADFIDHTRDDIASDVQVDDVGNNNLS